MLRLGPILPVLSLSLCARECPDDRVRASFGLNLCHPHSARSAYNSLARPMHDVHNARGHIIHDANLHDACGVLGRIFREFV